VTIIETERLYVRNIRPEDWKDMQEYLSREEVMRFESPWDTSDEGMRVAAKNLAVGSTFWAAELKTTGKMIGHIYFGREMPEKFLTWMLGYIFNDEFHGNGYATEACRGLMDHAFKNMGAHRIIGKCCPENIPSWKLMERLKMRREGHSLSCAAIRDTADGSPIWWDEYLYAMLADEWPGHGSLSI
jgi:RimJ/RimL family protein N-acetyltransferase